MNIIFKIAECEISTIVTSVKSSSSAEHDYQSVDILKAVAHNLVKPLSHLINCSFVTDIGHYI